MERPLEGQAQAQSLASGLAGGISAAKAQAASRGETLTRFIEQALRDQIAQSAGAAVTAEVRERDRLMEALLKRTAHFRVGRKPTRKETNAR